MTAISADITTPEGRASVLAACPDPDILVDNAGGPPTGRFCDCDEAARPKAVDDNMVTSMMLIHAVVDGRIARRFGPIVNVTSRSVKSPFRARGFPAARGAS